MLEVAVECKEPRSDVEEGPLSILWEKVIQQSIFVDISDDESVHFGDIRETFEFHLLEDSTPESSIHLSENKEPYHSDEDIQDVTSFLDIRKLADTGDPKCIVREASLQKPNTMQMCNEPGDTSDEDQEDLPYDGVLRVVNDNLLSDMQKMTFIEHNSRSGHYHGESAVQNPMVNCDLNNQTITDRSAVKISSNIVHEIQSAYLTEAHITENSTTDVGEGKAKDQSIKLKSSGDTSAVTNRSLSEGSHFGITDLLLKHLSQVELFNSSKYIEAETLPDLSLIDSVEESVLTNASFSLRHSKDGSRATENSQHAHSDSEVSQAKRSPAMEGAHLKESEGSWHRVPVSELDQAGGCAEASELGRRSSTPTVMGSHDHCPQRVPLGRARSCSELKYGQGQVHYPLPDFSKVAPKVRIPKGNNVVKPDNKTNMTKPRAFEGLPGKCNKTTMELIGKVLEDEVQLFELPLVLSNQQKDDGSQSKVPELDQHLQVEYDKLLARYAEAENVIDQMRLGNKVQGLSESSFPFQCAGLFHMEAPGKITDHPGLSFKYTHLPHTGKAYSVSLQANPQHLKESQKLDTSPKEINQLSEGEKMTTELKEIISQFMKKVEDFKVCLCSMSTDISQQQTVFKSLMDVQDQLERKYMEKKEQHRTLEMQNYMGLAINTGEFDPDSQVEGMIFKLGMLLENIKEHIDKNICGRFSPPASPSSPIQFLPVDTVMERDRTSSFSSSSPGPGKGNSLVAGAGVQTRGSPHTTGAHSVPQDASQENDSLGNLDVSTGRLEVATCEAEEEERRKVSSGPFHSGILLPSPVTTWQADQKEVESPWCVLKSATVPLCTDLQDTLSRVSDTKATHSSQRIQCALQIPSSLETDSGVGGLDTIPPDVEQLHSALQPQQFKEMTDSERQTSSSNVQTAVAQTVKTDSTTGQWTCSIAGDSSASLTGRTDKGSHTRCHKAHLTATPMVHGWPRRRATADARTHNPHCCPCHSSEVIRALQSEVARLKEDFEQGLLCLPYIIKRMDYLTSRYRQEKQLKRKSRTHDEHTSTSAQYRREAATKNNLKPIQVDDWISSDMQPSTRVSSEDLNLSLSVSQLHATAEGRNTRKEDICDRPQPCPDGHGRSWVKGDSFKAPTQDATISTASFRQSIRRSTQPTYQPLEGNLRSPCSLAASCTNPEQWPETRPRRRSVQSDSGLLPQISAFPKSDRPPRCTSRDQGQKHHRGNKDEDVRQTLDRAIRAAWNMKQTTERMAISLSADLAKAGFYRNLSPLDLKTHGTNTCHHLHTSSPPQHDLHPDTRHKYFTQGTV